MVNERHLGRIKPLDGLRAIAIILVIFRHAFKPFWEAMPDSFSYAGYNVLTPFVNGWIGVDLFFVLSGFLITRTFIRHRDEEGSVKAFLLKRVLRIVPAYYAVLIICTILILFGLMPNADAHNLGWRFLYHLLFLQDYFEANINVVFWSLGVEEKFYLLALIFLPFLLFLYQTERRFVLILTVVTIILSGVAMRWLSYGYAGYPDDYVGYFLTSRAPFHCCLDPLLFGVLIALLHQEADGKIVRCCRQYAKTIFLVSFIALFALGTSHAFSEVITLYDVTLQPILVSCIMAGLVLGAIYGGGFRWLESRLMYQVSVLSYSLYLVHLPLWSVAQKMVQFVPYHAIHNAVYLSIFFIFFITLSFLSAFAVHLLIEKPFLKLKNKL